MTLFAERTDHPFAYVLSFWQPGACKAARARLIADTEPGIAIVHKRLPPPSSLHAG